MKAVRTQLRNAQPLLDELKAKNGIKQGYKPRAQEGYFYIPVEGKPQLKTPCEYCNHEFEAIETKSLEGELAKRGFTKTEVNHLCKAFDVIGTIAVVELPEGFDKGKAAAFAQALMAVHPRVKTVARKAGATGGKFRVRPVEVIAGEKTTRTVHVEGGCKYVVDINKAYFQPRLSFERERIAGRVKRRENVLVLFAGVGPYAIAIAKKKPKAHVVAVELNRSESVV